MAELVVPYHPGYGGPELKACLQKFTTRGFLIATSIHLVAIGVCWFSIFAATEKTPRFPDKDRVIVLPPPPFIGNYARPVNPAPPGIKEFAGNPVPVPPTEVDPERTIPPQDRMYQQPAEPGGEPGEGVNGGIIEGPPPEFVAFEKAPVPVTQVWPVYPELARRAGLEGTVDVKVWVDREGKVRKAELYHGVSDVLNEAALDAAMKWTFAPALMNKGPVSVWVVIPFHFQLQGGSQ